MFIPDEFIQELKNRTDIVDVISSYVTLKKTGRNMQGLCPFHSEKTPSFNVSPDKNFFHCFGCQASGDVITFIRRIENLDYIEAVKFLAQRAGMEVPEGKASDGDLSRLRSRIYEANREAARFYYQCLISPDGKNAYQYLLRRGLSPKTIVRFGLGYSPSTRFALVNHLKNKGFTNYEIVQANLANESKNGNPYDRFSDRVMFPIIDLRGNVVAFGGRIMSDIKPKYLNTSDTPVFSKSRNLYALQIAKNKTADGQMILVEGYMDVIALHQAGFENTVATLGTALTKEQAAMISHYCKEPVICYDADAAGQKATERAIDIFRSIGMNVKILRVPNGKDPDEFIRSYGENGSAKFRILLDKCGNDIEYRIAKLRIMYDMEITEQKIAFLTQAAKVLSQLDNAIEQEIYIAKLAEECGVEKSAVARQVQRYTHTSQQEFARQQQRELSVIKAKNQGLPAGTVRNKRAANAEEALLALLMTNPDAAVAVCPHFPAENFKTPLYKAVYEKIKERAEKGLSTEPVDISGSFSVEENSRISNLVYMRVRENDPFHAIDIYIKILEEESEKLTAEQILNTDDLTINEQIQKKRNRKK